MKLYYHHVGQKGSDDDFPKTVFNSVPISLVEEAVSDSDAFKGPLLQDLRESFPSGAFNCWGVPTGAKFVIQNLKRGDIVLLVESARITGTVPALCEVQIYYNHQFPELSNALWGAHKYPYIFFFKTELITLRWSELLDLFGYRQNFDPRGQFYSVGENRLSIHGGPEGFVAHVRHQYGVNRGMTYSDIEEDIPSEVRDPSVEYKTAVESEFNAIRELSLSEAPQLHGGSERVPTIIRAMPRDAAFSLGVKRLYKNTCVICGLNVETPDGRPEVEAAHIYPKALDGADDFRNGVALCHFHHWAFDSGWLSFSDDLKVLVRSSTPDVEHYENVLKWQLKSIRLPDDERFLPHPIFLREHRKLHRFD